MQRSNAVEFSTGALQQTKTKPHVDCAKKLILKPEIYLVPIDYLCESPKLRSHIGAVLIRLVAGYPIKVCCAIVEKFAEGITAHIAVDQCLTTNQHLAR